MGPGMDPKVAHNAVAGVVELQRELLKEFGLESGLLVARATQLQERVHHLEALTKLAEERARVAEGQERAAREATDTAVKSREASVRVEVVAAVFALYVSIFELGEDENSSEVLEFFEGLKRLR